jgi:hypothetical protein
MSYPAVVARRSTVNKLAEFAQDQWGLITRRQIERVGVSRATVTRLAADHGLLDRVAAGVYRLTVAPIPDHMLLRAAWLQLAPDVPAWERTADQGVVSHRSAAAMYGIGHLPADRHEFTVPRRRQTRRPDVRLHVRELDHGWIKMGGLLVTLPSRIAADLLADHEDPEAVAQLIADSIGPVFDYAGSFADALAPYAGRFGLRKGDGLALLRWMLDLVGDPETDAWMAMARNHVARAEVRRGQTPEPGPATLLAL